MYSILTLAKKYIQYYIKAANGNGHGVHSPFVYQFIQQVLLDKKTNPTTDAIESVRAALLRDKNVVEVWDRGAGTKHVHATRRPIYRIAATSLKPKKFAQLLGRLVAYFEPVNVIEMGTSLGITTCYLAASANGKKVITMEGAPSIASLASAHFNQLNLRNIELIEGDFDNTLPEVLTKIETVGMAYVDGNHKYVPTMQYFNDLLEKANENSVFIFDDIHWSAEMEKAWNEIKMHSAVTLTIDLFYIGIVFFRKEHKEQEHFIIRF